jgi:hypothetical protein
LCDGAGTDQEVGKEVLADLDSPFAFRTRGLVPRTAVATEEAGASSPTIRLKGPSSTVEAHRTRGFAADAGLRQERGQPVTLEVRGQFCVNHVADDETAPDFVGLSFLHVAASGDAVLVTSNPRHFPKAASGTVRAFRPADCPPRIIRESGRFRS